MKHNSRVGDCYALTEDKPKYLKIRYISLLAVLTIMCLYAVQQASAQPVEPAATAVADIKPLQIGDTIPEWFWQIPLQVVNHPEGKDTITLNDYKGKKLMILEFGGTACAPCIKSVEELTAIEKEFSDGFKLIPISSQRPETIQRFQEKRGWYIEYVVSDKIMQDIFPHDIIPHLVWINNSKIAAITASTSATREAISAVIKGEGAPVDRKADRSYDREKPLLINSNAGDINDFKYHSMFTGHIPGLMGGITTAENRITFRNGSMIDLFKLVFQLKYRTAEFSYPNRVYLELSSDTKEYADTQFFCYELFVSNGSMNREQLANIAFDDVRRYFLLTKGIKANKQKREVTCLVLHKLGEPIFAENNTERIAIGTDAERRAIQQGDAGGLYSVLANTLRDNCHPLVNELNGYKDTAIQLTGDLTDLKNLNHQLARVGLTISTERREIEMLVIAYNQ